VTPRARSLDLGDRARRFLFAVPFLLGASSIATLLLYFYGVSPMRWAVMTVLVPAAVALTLLMAWSRTTGWDDLYRRTADGLWAGALATLTYDLVRVPIAWAGLPVFKAISYFGTVMLGEARPTAVSEALGWTYHLSNGVGFGLMYASLFATPRWWTAIGWGLLLEGAMLVTPYAEVFGYQLSSQFLMITIGAHVVYGATLWAALRYRQVRREGGSSARWRASPLTFLCIVPIGIGAIAVDFHARHATQMPSSPPPHLGPHLYTTWNVLEPDRLAVLWVQRRFVDPQARFHFVPPFSPVRPGTPFDVPEAEIRRSGARSATEVLVAHAGLERDERLALLTRMTHLYEISLWRLPTDPEAQVLGAGLVEAATDQCDRAAVGKCVERAFRYLDAWYERK
jgi:hypothetical protein